MDKQSIKVPYYECDKGWNKLIDPLVEYCKKNYVNILQIKEKFGGLRFYVSQAPDELYDMIRKAEEESYHICEVCGEPGERRDGNWVKTTCEEHKLKNLSELNIGKEEQDT